MTVPFDGITPIPDICAEEVEKFVAATLHYADQGRRHLKLAPEKRMRITLPYNLDLKPLFSLAEPIVEEHFVFFDWTAFQRWDIPRDLADDFDPAEVIVHDPDGALIKMPWDDNEYSPCQARTCAARLMAAADYLDSLNEKGK